MEFLLSTHLGRIFTSYNMKNALILYLIKYFYV